MDTKLTGTRQDGKDKRYKDTKYVLIAQISNADHCHTNIAWLPKMYWDQGAGMLVLHSLN